MCIWWRIQNASKSVKPYVAMATFNYKLTYWVIGCTPGTCAYIAKE